uniref:Uncharacterized protein n=1 Tax=Timema bartmani TaxID=61472 RepID=A0A7R9F9N0_9NEOP|nr:unnamed protein product [Timema bartmani]
MDKTSNFYYEKFGVVKNHKDIPIYNNVSGKHSLTFNESASIVFERICEIPSKQAIWYPWAILTRTLFWYRLLAIILHVIPAVYLDLVFMLKRKSPISKESIQTLKLVNDFVCVGTNDSGTPTISIESEDRALRPKTSWASPAI